MLCPYCNHKYVRKRGFNRKGLQVYKCKNCQRKYTTETYNRINRPSISCPYCESNSSKKDGVFCYQSGEYQRYYCHDCNQQFYVEMASDQDLPHSQLKSCKWCGKLTGNPQFCDSQCSGFYLAEYISKPRQQQQPRKIRCCKYCGKVVQGRKEACLDCNPNHVDWTKRTLAEARDMEKYQVHAAIRNRARRIYRNENKPESCANCGYDKKIHVCHIRAINDFPDDASIAEINSPDNLIALCPNCHWEFDNGLLSITDMIETS